MADNADQSEPEIKPTPTPAPGDPVQPDPGHDTPDAEPEDDAAVAEPETKKVPHPWHD